MTNNKYQLSSVQNAMTILNLFKSSKHNDLSVAEIAKKTGLAKSTAHRLISTLTKEGFLSKNPRTGEYRVGLSLLTLGGVISVHKEIYQAAFPLVESLVKEIKETCHICLIEQFEVVYYYRVKRKDPETLVTNIGRKNPIHCTSEGLALLAFQDEAYIEQVLNNGLPSFTNETMTTPSVIRDRLASIKEKGYVIATEEYYKGYIGIAVPIRDYSANVVSSLAMIGPVDRITEANYSYYITKLKETAAEISEEMGYYGD
ncbi:IclR family transcriptional regulator [Salibacterium salarium]|uniref:Glycerol operon regulatory protein n=1 Tax=Salibacterium salarium TaxID=284579 RepID=A0A3R9P620_9BACI|nr:IclR family transcriptional regulator [Salibacterium salarium]RSL33576.1 IclR family transcriptional regulator [Salibacterium salarium]